jgi:protein-disulfide isomerase
MSDTAYKLGDCIDCDASLNIAEDHYYEYRCEACERKWFERVEAWKAGAEDPELDASFTAKPDVRGE